MNLIDLLTDLAERGVSLWLDGPRLRFSAPDGVMTDQMIGTLKAHRQEIIEILESTDVGEQASYEPIRPAPRSAEMPLTLAQRAMWFQDQLDPGTPAYNVPGGLRISGVLEPGEMETYLNQVIARHEALRTRYASIGGRPVQVVEDQARISVEVVDLSHLPPDERQAEVERQAAEEAAHRLDLAAGPPIHARLLRLGTAEHVLLPVLHHSVSDAWSVGVFLRDLAGFARAQRTGRPVALPELPIHYPDFAIWQQEWLESPEAEKQLAYWRHCLEGMPEALELPTDRPRPAVRSSRGGLHVFRVPPGLVNGLHEVGRQLGATLFMTVAAAFDVLLYRSSGSDDVVIGSLVAHRTRPELENLIGLFINAVVLRTSLAGDPSFATLIQRMRETVLGAQANQDLPFELLVEKLQPRRDPSRPPLFQVMLNLVNTPLGLPEIPGLELKQLVPEKHTATLDLYLALTEGDDGLLAELEYSTDLFDRATAERLAARLCRVLEAVVEDPHRRISRMPLLTRAEQAQLVRWQDPALAAAAVPEPILVHERILARARRHPKAVAVSWGEVELSYGELEARVGRLAQRLARSGIGPESIVGVLLERSPDLVVAVLGLLSAGAAYLPLDPATPRRRIEHMLKDTGATLVLTSVGLRGLLDDDPEGSRPDATGMPGLAVLSDLLEPGSGDAVSGSGDAVSGSGGPRPVLADSPAYVIYTSGSTGRPKGVVLTHRGLAAAAGSWLEVYGLADAGSEGRSHLQVAAFTFDVFLEDLVRCLCSGGRLVLCPREIVLDAGRLVALLRQEQVYLAELVPAVLRTVVEHLQSRGESLDYPRVLPCGADVWYGDEYRAVRRLMAPGGRAVNTYGVTEVTIDSTWFDGDVADGCGSWPVPAGRPFAGVRAVALDPELAPAPIGVPGELYLGGDVLARGYAGRPDLTAAAFVPDPDPARPGQRLYRTGDLARWTEGGILELLGRRDAQLKVRGFRIEPGEIESVLEQHPLVRRAAVVGIGDPGGRDKRLVAFVVPGARADAAEAAGAHEQEDADLRERLTAHLAAELPEYMVPASFVVLDELPLSPNGKLDRRALAETAAEAPVASVALVLPRTPVEQRMVAIWGEVLGRDGFGVEDSFFELGGHSLLVAQVASRIREAFEVELDLRAMFTSTTVAGVARLVEEAQLLGSEAASAAFSFDEGAL